MKKTALKILEILLLLICFSYVFLLSIADIDTIINDFEYWGYEQWPWYMRDKETFIIYSIFELSFLWGIFTFILWLKHKRSKKYILALILNFIFYITWYSFDIYISPNM